MHHGVCIFILFYSVPANFRSLVYFYGIANGGRKEWDFAFDQFKKTTIASERRKILYGLSASSEPWIVQRYSGMSFVMYSHVLVMYIHVLSCTHGGSKVLVLPFPIPTTITPTELVRRL